MTVRQDYRVLIAGSRDATHQMLDYARRVVRRAHEKSYTVVVGDNPKGVDKAVVQECRRLQAKVIVCGIANFPRNGGCKHGEYIKVARDIYRAGKGRLFHAYHAGDPVFKSNLKNEIFQRSARILDRLNIGFGILICFS